MLFNTDNLSNDEFVPLVESFINNRHFGPYHTIVVRVIYELIHRLQEADDNPPVGPEDV